MPVSSKDDNSPHLYTFTPTLDQTRPIHRRCSSLGSCGCSSQQQCVPSLHNTNRDQLSPGGPAEFHSPETQQLTGSCCSLVHDSVLKERRTPSPWRVSQELPHGRKTPSPGGTTASTAESGGAQPCWSQARPLPLARLLHGHQHQLSYLCAPWL